MSAIRDMLRGSSLAIIAFLLLFSSFNILAAPVEGQQQTVFSVTLAAPTSNPVRRQYAAIITQSMQQVGIDARLVYLSFPALIDRFWPADNKTLGKPFEEGSFSIGFIGWGQTSPIVEFKGQFTSEPGDLAPVGNNYYLYENQEVNKLAADYAKALEFNDQVRVLKQLQAVLYRDMPNLPVYYFAGVAAMDPNFRPWGLKDFYRAVTFPDLHHWGGLKELNYAEVGDVDNINPLQTTESNSFYALYIYGAIGANPQFIDARDFSFKLDLAESITSSADGKTWTVKLRQGLKFHDGVEVTADDAVYTHWLVMHPEVASVNFGIDVDKIGSRVTFKFLNGTTTVLDNTAKGATPTQGSVEAVDKYTYRITLRDVYFAAKDLIVGNTGGANGIWPKHLLEQIAPGQINSHPFSTMRGSYTYTWDTAKYGGSGSYTANGPVGAGPYNFQGYDFTSRVATLKKNPNYWNKTGLESIGQFSVETYRVATIVEKESAIAAYRNKEVNVLDPNYSFQQDMDRLKGLGLSVAVYDDLGWQEIGFNMRHPIVGTGTGTPLGRATPSQAAEAARHVRKAISYLIPRQLIIDRLLNGLGTPGVTFVGPYAGARWDTSLKADPYDPAAAKRELAAAGYGVQPGTVNPIQFSPITIAPPPAEPVIIKPELSPNITGIQVKPVTLDAQYLFGSSVTVGGSFTNPITREPRPNFALIIQESTDSIAKTEAEKANWKDVATARTDSNGLYSVTVTPPKPGAVYYRAFFPGFTVPPANYPTPPSASELRDLLKSGSVPLVLPQSFSPVSEVKSVTLAEFAKILTSSEAINELAVVTTKNLKTLADSQKALGDSMTRNIESLSATSTQNFNSLRDSTTQNLNTLKQETTTNLQNLKDSVPTKSDLANTQQQLSSQIANLQAQVATLTTGLYIAIAIAVILGALGIVSGIRAGRKTKGA
ncbi:MAG: hypothetical protein HYU39_00805 [Thaumarchaeota archaeon]|nr:hypothetical protein [Nitrososphaerota archaeon]